jgi:hypothetical protein
MLQVIDINVLQISGRAIIDAHAYYVCQKSMAQNLLRGIEEKPASGSESPSSEEETTGNENNNNLTRNEDLKEMTDIECILANPRVKGFDLKSKEFCENFKIPSLIMKILIAIPGEFDLDELHPPGWSDKPYEKLVLPDGERELVLAFADRDRLRETCFDDFIQHKGIQSVGNISVRLTRSAGEGIIILLCGPPGVGKTLTAEAGKLPFWPAYVAPIVDSSQRPKNLNHLYTS